MAHNTKHYFNYIFAGDATFTLRNKSTGVKLQYRLYRSKRNPRRYLVSIFTTVRKDVKGGFYYIGEVWLPANNGYGVKYYGKDRCAEISEEINDKYTKGLEFLLNELQTKEYLHKGMALDKGITCCVCGRLLTNEVSKLSGIGPECAKKITL